MRSVTSDITVVTGQRGCKVCDSLNQVGNEFCHACGSPLGNVPEIVLDPSEVLDTQEIWRVHGVETELVGRSEELEELVARFVTVGQTGESQIVLLLGEDGVGKSRLIAEFSQRINTAFGDALLISSSWRGGSERAYAIVDRLLRSRFYIPERLQPSDSRSRLLEGVKAIVKTPVAVELTHRIGQLISLPYPDSPFAQDESPETIRRAAWRALATFLRIDASANSMALVLDDFQFATPESLGLIPFLTKELVHTPILWLISATPDFAEAHERELAEIPNLSRIHLRELGDDEIRELCNQVLDRVGNVPSILHDIVCTRAMGNPLVAEEILRLLMAEGVIDTSKPDWSVNTTLFAEIELPQGLFDVVAASLQHLSGQERRLLEMAATVGETFWHGPVLLAYQAESPVPSDEFFWPKASESPVAAFLDALEVRDLIRRQPESSFVDEVEYRFKHAATRNQLLADLDEERAKKLHGLTATWYELNRNKGRVEDETLAFHLDSAGQSQRAAAAYVWAAQGATANHLNDRALAYYTRTLELLDSSQVVTRMEVLHELGGLLDLSGEYERSIPYLRQLLEGAWALVNPAKGGVAHNKLGRVYRNLGQLDRATKHFECALHLFRRANDKVGIASTLDDVGRVDAIRGAYDSALHHFTDALQRRQQLGDKRSIALSLNNLGALMLEQGNFKEALLRFREALSVRKQIGDKRGVASSLNGLGVMLAERGQLEQALNLWNEGIEVARAIGDRPLQGGLLANVGEICCTLGRLDEAEEALTAAALLGEECDHRRLLFEVSRNRGLLALRRANKTEAAIHVETALALAAFLESPVLRGVALRALGEVHSHSVLGSDSQDTADKAREAFDESIAILAKVGREAERGRTLFSYAVFELEQGEDEAAMPHLVEAQEVFSRLGMASLLKRAESLIADLKP